MVSTCFNLHQVKFQLKKVLCMGVAVGNVGMTPDELRPDVFLAWLDVGF